MQLTAVPQYYTAGNNSAAVLSTTYMERTRFNVKLHSAVSCKAWRLNDQRFEQSCPDSEKQCFVEHLLQFQQGRRCILGCSALLRDFSERVTPTQGPQFDSKEESYRFTFR